MKLKPIATEKAIMKVERDNIISFLVDEKSTKAEIEKEIENLFKVKVEKIRTSVRNNQKIAYVKLNKKYLAIDLATKLGLM
ncbi:MAG: 50S ribosomal protein L23P [Candidatus Diapherotrites archaeon ADurb.Bin253]|nr:MAG: 50S ribosomal protein L23P [Candidatus Diapherotrites archaeon ADurb.Bin253]HQC61292.1 50S ribosomal protein L23 [Candidatus Pacearchaeota archaeon]